MFVPVNEPVLDGDEKKYLIECIDTNWISSEGPFVKEFEERFSAKVGRKYGIAVCNGTAALDAAVTALGLENGDEVIMPTFTIISSINQLIRNGAKPVLVDSDPSTWNMDVTQVEKKITKRTKAIMIVHIYGLPVDMDPILRLAKKHNLKVIEDAAEMIGQTYKGKPCGSFGDISIFSFYPNKHITTGEGGMIVVNDEKLAEKCRSLRNLCFKPEKRFVHDEMGWNMRMTNFQAGIGLAQLKRLDKFVEKKRWIGKQYTKLLKGNPNLQTPLEETSYAKNIYWVYGLIIKDGSGLDAESAMKKLAENGVGTRPFFWPMHQQPVFNKMGYFLRENYPVAEVMARMGFYVPSGLAITKKQIEYVASIIQKIFKETKKIC